MTLKSRVVITLLVLFVLVGVQSIYANPVYLRLNESGGATSGTVLGTNMVTFAGSVGQWTINSSTGTNPLLNGGFWDLGSFNAASDPASSNTLTILFSETNVTGPVGSWLMDIGGTQSNDSFVFDTWVDAGNSAFAMTTAIGALSSGSSSYALSGGPFAVPISGTYSITERITLTPVGTGGSHTFGANANLRPVPEPSSLVLLGIGLLGVGIGCRRMKWFAAK